MREQLEQVFSDHQARFIKEWGELVRFPSVSNDPNHADDCLACATWLVDHLAGLGFESQLCPTAGKPVAYAVRNGAPDKPVILFYGHYDVQPVDPLDAWDTPPFELTERNGRYYGRGAQDNKGQFFYVLKAIEALLAQGHELPTIKVVLEGEEECGSGSLLAELPEWQTRVAADILMVCDTDTVRSGTPTIIMGLRGIAALSIKLTGANHDLHSGLHGGVAPNPALGMARLVASLHDDNGRIAVKGFYDDVRPPTAEEQKLANAEPFDEALYIEEAGTKPVAGEQGFSPVERLGFQPCLDANGIHSGYGGDGVKTIIPAEATAKLSARLVPDQNPERCLAAIVAHCKAHVPDGMELHIDDSREVSGGFRLNIHSDTAAKAKAVLDTLSDRPTAFLWEGASIPIVASLAATANAEPLLVGFGSEADRIHAPNESFSLTQFRSGYLYAGLFLAAL